MRLTIRNLEATDEAPWRALWNGYCEFYETEMAGSVTDETWRRLLDASEEGMFSLVACGEDGNVIGFTNCVVHPITWSETPVCYLEDLFVAPDARNSGAGRALIEAVLEKGRAKGWHRVYWRTRHDNATARALYDKVSDLTDGVVYEVPL